MEGLIDRQLHARVGWSWTSPLAATCFALILLPECCSDRDPSGQAYPDTDREVPQCHANPRADC
jgi:hypothetical protein